MDLKNHIYESLHLWGLIPSPEDRAKMSATEIQEYTIKAITEILKGKEYIHSGTNTLGVRYFISSAIPYLLKSII